jgi:hypothetical protein
VFCPRYRLLDTMLPESKRGRLKTDCIEFTLHTKEMYCKYIGVPIVHVTRARYCSVVSNNRTRKEILPEHLS